MDEHERGICASAHVSREIHSVTAKWQAPERVAEAQIRWDALVWAGRVDTAP